MRTTVAAPGPVEGAGGGASALWRQSGEPDSDAARGGKAAHKEHPAVPSDCPSTQAERGGHRGYDSSGGATGTAMVAEMVDRIRGSPVVHADETGWRQDGVNGYVWTFSTPTDRYFLRRGRGKEVVDEALGDSFDGVLVSDFYAAYNHYPGLKQRAGYTCCGTSVIWRRCTLMTLACLVGLERCASSTTRPPALPLPTVRRPAISSQCHPTNWRWRDGYCRCATPSPTTKACLMPSSADA